MPSIAIRLNFYVKWVMLFLGWFFSLFFFLVRRKSDPLNYKHLKGKKKEETCIEGELFLCVCDTIDILVIFTVLNIKSFEFSRP